MGPAASRERPAVGLLLPAAVAGWLALLGAVPPPAARADEPVRYRCDTGREIDAALRVRIEAAGRRVLRLVAARRADELFDAAHALLRDALPRQALARRLEEIGPFVRRPSEARLGRLLLVDAEGGRDRVWTVACREGPGPDPAPTLLHLKLADERVALAEFLIPGVADGMRLSLELRQVGSGFGVAAFEPRFSTWLGRKPAFYVERGTSRARRQPLLADLDYAVATHLAGLAASASTPAERRIAALRRELRDGTAWRRALRLAGSRGAPAVEVVDLGVTVAGAKLVPRVAWRGPLPLAGPSAARAVRDRLLDAVPELGFEFDRVLLVPVGSGGEAGEGRLLPLAG